MKKTLMALVALLLPLSLSAQLISVQQGTGRVETKKESKKNKEKKENEVNKEIKETKEIKVKEIKVNEEVKDAEPSTTVQENKDIEASVKADLVSHYIWRGQDLAGFSIQPSASLSWRGLSLTAEGSAGLQKDDYYEMDLTLGYKLGPVNIGVTDMWCSGLDAEDRYLYYNSKLGAHKFEGNLGVSCKYFSLQGYCMFWGNDYKIDSDRRAYSTYIELSVPFRISGIDFEAKVGGTPMESGGWWETRTRQTELGEREVNTKVYEYGEGPSCCLASLRATKDLHFKDVSLPVFAEISVNPYMSKATMLFGISIIPW